VRLKIKDKDTKDVQQEAKRHSRRRGSEDKNRGTFRDDEQREALVRMNTKDKDTESSIGGEEKIKSREDDSQTERGTVQENKQWMFENIQSTARRVA
jgi:hypothetical protein